MKRALSLIMVLALVLCLTPAVFAADETLVSVTDQTAPYTWTWTATADGTLHVNATPAYSDAAQYAAFKVSVYASEADYKAGGDPISEGLPQIIGDPWSTPVTDYDVTAGQFVVINVTAQKGWVDTTGNVGLDVTFTAGAAAVEKVDIAFDDLYDSTYPITAAGTYDVTLLENANWTMFLFTPTEIGFYEISVAQGEVGYSGAGSYYTYVPFTSGTSIEREIKAVGQSIVFAIKNDTPDVQVTITKTKDSEGIVTITYVPWENKVTPDASVSIPALTQVDITEAHTAVKISDSEYRLDSANGPRIYVDLETGEWSMNNAMPEAITIRAEYEGTHYNFRAPLEEYLDGEKYGLGEYYPVMSKKGGQYPLTTDLLAFIKGWGGAQGWTTVGISPFASVNSGNADPDTAWMAVCLIDPESAVTDPVVEPNELVLGDNAIVVEDGMNGVDYTFTAEEDGKYTIAKAEGEENAFLTMVTENGSEQVVLPYHVDMTAGQSLTFNISTNDGSPDTIDLVVSKVGEHECVAAADKEYVYADDYTYFDLVTVCEICGEPISYERWYNFQDQNPETPNIEYTANVPAGETGNYSLGGGAGTVLTLSAENITLVINGEEITPVDGVYTYSIESYYGTEIQITNNGTADGTYEMVLSYPLGSYTNPDTLPANGSVTVSLPDDNYGYYYTWTATCPGTYTFTVSGDMWAYVYNYDMYDHDFTPEMNSQTVTVAAGDVVELCVTSFDPSNYSYPATDITVECKFEHASDETFVVDAAVPAGCVTTGLTEGSHCGTCGEVIVAQEETPALGHGELVHTEKVAPTKETEGLKENWFCPVCGKYYTDAECKNEIAEADLVIPKVSNPATGDSFSLVLFAGMAVLSILGLAAVGVMKKKSMF